MSSKIFPWIVVIAVAVLIGFVYWGKKADTTQSDSSIILFVGNGCPHCENVEAFANANNIIQYVPYETREVFDDKKNAALMRQKAATCASGQEITGVPFLWADNGATCLVGDVDIINYFKIKSGK